MSLMGILEIGNASLLAQKTALEVTGENIANVNTPGYSRQTAVLETASAGYDRYLSSGNGVKVSTVQRSYDRFLMTQIKAESSANGEMTTTQSYLQRIEPLFNDIASDGLGKSLQDFFNAWQDLSMNPQGAAERQSVLATAQSLVDDFHRISSSLNTIKSDANQSLVSITSDINQKTRQIADLNTKIMMTEQKGGNANALRDTRDQLVNDLAGKVGINYFEEASGAVVVSLAGGPQLVDGTTAASLTLAPDAANTNFYNVFITPAAGGSATDVTPLLVRSDGRSGELGGAIAVRDTLVNGFLSDLDELATSIASQLNGLHAAGYGTTGTTGIDFFTPPPAPVPPATFTSGYSWTMALNVTNINDIAAADADPTAGSGTGNNINAQRIADLKDVSLSLTGGSATLTGFYAALVGKVGLSVQTTEKGLAQNGAVMQQLDRLRESTSGVSLDEELAALIRYQKAFEGAAKLISTGQDMLDTVLNMVR
jgi:flagellar hook-associated protein 1 FlgK